MSLATKSPMPRKVIPYPGPFPIHINARAVNKEPFKLELNTVWEIMENYLSLIARMYNLKIHSFVLMPNHFHLLLSPSENNLGGALNYFMRETSKEIGRNAGRVNQVYGGRAYKTVITTERHFRIAYKYVYRNPVKANLCQKVEEYDYSTLAFLVGRTRRAIPLEQDTQLFCPDFSENTLNWLNTSPAMKNETEVKLALRRRIFKLPKDDSKVPSSLESEPF